MLTRVAAAPDIDLLLARPPRALDDLSDEQRRALVDAAYRHGLLQAVSGRLPRGDAFLRARFHALAAVVRARDAALRESLDATLAALRARAIEVCPLKGPVLADRFYPDPALRSASDLDLLVREDQLEAAVEAVEADGYRLSYGFRAWYERRHAHHVTLVHPERSPIELHFRPRSGTGSRLRTDDVLARSRPHETASGAIVRVLAPEDELVFLALHAAHHLVERRGWVLDLVLLLDAHPGLDWSVVAERACAARCRRAVGYVLLHLHRLGIAVPDELLRAMAPARAKLVDRLRRAALDRAKRERLAQVARLASQVLMCDGPFLAAGHVVHAATWSLRRNAHRAVQRLRRLG